MTGKELDPALPAVSTGESGREPMLPARGLAAFALLQQVVARHNEEGGYAPDHDWHHRLTLAEVGGLYDIAYHGEVYLRVNGENPEMLADLLQLLASPEIAPKLRSFAYSTQGSYAANGTYDYSVDALAFGDHSFPNLLRLALPQGHGEHGYMILETKHRKAGSWEAAHVPAQLLNRAPLLQELSLPVPPDDEFLQGPPHPLKILDVDSGFDAKAGGFIRRLAGSTRFPSLETLRFTDYRQDYMQNWRADATPFDDYLALFRSPVARRLRSIALRETSLTNQQIQELMALRSDGVEIASTR